MGANNGQCNAVVMGVNNKGVANVGENAQEKGPRVIFKFYSKFFFFMDQKQPEKSEYQTRVMMTRMRIATTTMKTTRAQLQWGQH